jgi:heme exporter protein B
MNLPGDVLWRLELGLLVGTPGLAALTLGRGGDHGEPEAQRRAGGAAGAAAGDPILIFGAGLIERGNEAGALQLLAASSLLLVAGAPFAAGAAIRAGRE